MTQRQVLQKIRAAVADLEDRYYTNAGDAFAHWAMQTYFELDDDDALEACNVSGPGDKGVDAYWPDEQQRVVVVAQAKYAARPKTFGKQSVVELQSAWGWVRRLAAGERAKARPELRSKARQLAQLWHSDPDYPVDLYCFVNGSFSQAAEDEREAFNKDHADSNVRVVLVGLEELTERLKEQASRTEDPPDADIELELQRYFEFEPPGEPKTVVASINALELAEIERDYRYSIFQRNVRYWLRATGRVNKGIRRTIETATGRGKFWYYNNGIAIVCDSIDVDPYEDEEGGLASVRNLQIVNGCQTTTTLGETIEELDDEGSPAFVLVRIFEAADERLQSDISLYNNRQNAVKDRDLLSNDEPQSRLEVEFDQLDPPWFYERKRGQWDAQIKPDAALKRRYGNGTRRIDNEVAAQAAHAFWYDPAVARARKRMLFVRKQDDENGLYEDLFDDDTTPEWLLVPYRIGRYIATRKRDYMRQLKEALKPARPTTAQRVTIQRSWLKFADQFVLGAIRVYLDQEVELYRHDVLEQLLDDDLFDEFVARAYTLAIRDLNPFFRQKHDDAPEDDPFDMANYVKSKWEEVEAYLADQCAYRAEVDENPFEEIDLPR